MTVHRPMIVLWDGDGMCSACCGKSKVQASLLLVVDGNGGLKNALTVL